MSGVSESRALPCVVGSCLDPISCAVVLSVATLERWLRLFNMCMVI